MISPRNRIATAALAGALVAAGAAPAFADTLIGQGPPPSDPVMQWAEDSAPPNHFFLNNRQDDEVVRFRKARTINVCDAKARPNELGDSSHAYPIKVKWDGKYHVIEPGSCHAVDARKLKIRADAPLAQNVDLTGKVTMHG